MLKIDPPNYKFCPLCGSGLEERIEEEKIRKFCSNCNWTYYPHVAAAAAVVIRKQNKILLVKRSRDPYKNTWMIPAGFVDFGEHPEETARREALEEIGLKVNSVQLLKVFQSKDDYRSPGHFVFFYEAQVEGEIKNNDLEENSDIGWFNLDNLPEIGWENHRKMLDKIIKNSKQTLSNFQKK